MDDLNDRKNQNPVRRDQNIFLFNFNINIF